MAAPAKLLPPTSVSKTYAQDQNSPLHVASLRGDYDSVLMLLLGGADIHALNVWKETPLHQCTSGGHLSLILLLLDSGAHVNALDHENITPLHQAVIHANKGAAELLLCYGASVFNVDQVTDTLPVIQLVESVHVCHDVITKAVGRVWSLQHLCRVNIRKSLGVRCRGRLKELPLPKHLLSFLSTLPVACRDQLHMGSDQVRTSKAQGGRKRGRVKIVRGQGLLEPSHT